MVLTVLALLIVGGIVFKGMTGDERVQAAQRAVEFVKDLKHALRTRPEETVFHNTIKERCPWAVATLTVVTLTAVVFLFILFGEGSLSDSKTLLGWGGSLGPRTTNGEWWRVGTSMFVHAGLFQLLVTVAALLQVGSIVERLFGPATFTATYLTAGLFGSLVNLSARRADVGFGASAAVFGIYGLLFAFLIWSRLHPSHLTIPRPAVKKLVPAFVLFVLYNMASDSLGGAAEITGLATGFICGLALVAGAAADPKPVQKRVGAVIATAVVIAVASAVSLRGIADIWPELERIVAAEDRAATEYKKANDQFNKRRITSDALAELIDQTIIPELTASQERLSALRKVPQEHQSLLADATQYLKLRSDSWRFRADGLRKIELRGMRESDQTQPVEVAVWRRRAETQHRANLSLMGNAEGKTKAALVVLEKIRTRLRGAPSPV